MARKKTDPEPPPARRDPFRLAAVPGATPGKWISRWREQRPFQPIELVHVEARDQIAALRDGRADAVIARRPLTGDDLHAVDLYDEIPVVVAGADSHLAAADELVPADLDGEILITPLDDVLGPLALPTAAPSFAPIERTEDAIATVASGVGILVVPMSLARANQRRDVVTRPLVGGPLSSVVLAWLRDRDDDDVQALVGITRGRTARSSR
ncbi:LysR substrate-binding domain-containing protein [Microbacterium indicum]|uniref:LysR substrate-binding domain-containing protein n=1 Tax=Microbacterium indicum TaxID=358100 RepID=UPI0003FA9C4F|nr:LysR substrate-binding domain-containing protein [Microbacterium indicum]